MKPVGTERLPLFAVTHARLHGADTSLDAAVSMVTEAQRQARHLYDALVTWGPLTCDEADAKLGWRPTTAGRRISDLVRAGLARSTAARRVTRSRRWAVVYEAVSERVRAAHQETAA